MELYLWDIIFSLGLTLGVGSSTFALIFFIKALQDGVMDDSERGFLRTVIVVLRIGMALSALGLLGYWLSDSIPEIVAYRFQWALLAIITVNAILMDKRIMPMKYGPVLAGGSWYSFFFVSKLPVYLVPVWVPLIEYAVFLLLFYFIFHFLKKRFTSKSPQTMPHKAI